MALPIYAKSLFSLMKVMGWDQQGIARRLGVSKTACSLWARGKRPISKRYEEAFLDLVASELHNDMMRTGTNSAHARELYAYIEAWVHEMHSKAGSFRRLLRTQFERLQGPLGRKDPDDMTKVERQLVRSSCQMIIHLFDFLESVGRPVHHVGAPPKEDPVTHFRLMRETFRRKEPLEG
jgi:DNA-binding transcriptional regulator YdaS (Cro superfamily)